MKPIKKTEYKIDALILSGSRIHEYLRAPKVEGRISTIR